MVDLRHYSAPKNLICISLAGVGQETAGDGFKIFRWVGPRIAGIRPMNLVKQSPLLAQWASTVSY